ncbi:MAG: GAF domain-containing protein [Candidatus Bathyarchaeota archaeon]
MLSVDDDSDQLFFLKRNLERLNKAITVETVTSPREALNAIKDSAFDCIVSDYKMPAMDGVELCKRIKEKVDTPFIIYTGQGSEEVAERAFHAGADDYVRKEVDPSHYQLLARRVEQAVARYRVEELYRTVVDGSRDAFTIKDGTTIVYANQAMADLVGFQGPEGLVGVDASTWVHPDDQDTYINWTLSRQNGQEAPKFLEFRIVKPNGEERIIEASFSRVNYRGNPANLAFNRDVTDRKAIEEAVQKEVELRETILRSMQDIVSLKDLSYHYIFVNDAAFPDGKTEPEDAVGRMCYEVNYQRDRPCEGCVYAVVLETGEPRKDVAQLPDGRILHTFASPIRDEEGRMVQVLSVSRDITELTRARRRLEALHSHVLRLSETQSLQEIADRSLEIIEDALQFPKGAFGVVRDGYLEWIDESSASLPEFRLALDGPGITVRAVRTGEAQLVADTRLDSDFVSNLEKYRGVKHLSELDVLVKVHGRVAAVINLESTEASAFTDDDRRLLEVFAGHVASSMERVLNLERERQLRRSLEALHSSAVDIIESTSTEEVYSTCLDVAEAILSGGDGSLGVIEGDKVDFRYITSGLRDEYKGFKMPLDGRGIVNRALATGLAVYVPDVSLDEDYVQPGGLRDTPDYRSELAVPITVDDAPVAVINFESPRVDGFDDNARRLLEMLGLYASTALKRLSTLEEERVWAAKLEALHRGALALSEAETAYDVYRAATEIIREDFGFQWAGVGEIQGEWLRYMYYSGISIEGSDRVHLSSRSVMVRSYKSGETQLVRDVREDPDYVILSGAEVHFLSEIAVPVRVDGDVRAVINVESTELDAFAGDDRRLLELLALHVSSSLSRLTAMDELEQQVAEKTGELLDAERLAAVGRVASMVAHDLRSPLQTIRNVSYLVSRDPSKAKEYCPVIDENVRYASSIVEDLRDAVAPGKLRRAPVNLVELVSAALGESAVPDSVEVRREFQEDFLAANVDAVKLRRALENLIKNAVEAMPKGGVLTVGLAQVDGDAVVSVGDTGGGIPEEARASVFKPFFSTKPRGTGLGLAIAKQGVEAHGGSIGYESEVGVGTVFTLRLPLKG